MILRGCASRESPHTLAELGDVLQGVDLVVGRTATTVIEAGAGHEAAQAPVFATPGTRTAATRS